MSRPNPRRWRVTWSPGVDVAVATGLFLAATASHFALRSEAAIPVEVTADHAVDPGRARFSADWWNQPQAVCPVGTQLHGAAPPEGREVWCAHADGTREGLHLGWHTNERTAFLRDYRDGVLDGRFTEWFPSGQIAREGENRMGVRRGRWVRWSESGEVAEWVNYDDRGLISDRTDDRAGKVQAP